LNAGGYRNMGEDEQVADTSHRPNPASGGAEDAVAAAIGASVRKARLRSGLSTRELAQRAGMSQPFLSNIENGRSTPSVATLYKLASALGVGASELLPAGKDDGVVVVRAGEGVPTGMDETPGVAQSVLLAGAPGRLLEARWCVIQPGQPAGDWFEHAGEDFLHVIEGVLRVELGTGRVEQVGAGDSLWLEGDIPHRWEVGPTVGATLLLVTAHVPGATHGLK
jgi:transcriptional regulator with XRE-family HTH domain